MTSRRLRPTLLVPAFLAFGLTLANAGAAGPENIALGRPVRVTPALPKNAAATLQALTDGQRAPEFVAGSEGVVQFSIRDPRQLTVDLGQVMPIGGVAVSTVAGHAMSGKEFHVWPGRIDLYTSDDNRLYRHAGELTSLHDAENGSLPPFSGVAERRTIRTNRLAAQGRYVKLVFSYGREMVLDEVEIYKGDPSRQTATAQGREFHSEAEIAAAWQLTAIDPSRSHPEAEVANAKRAGELQSFVFRRRYLQDIDALLEQARTLPARARKPIVGNLQSLRKEALESEPKGHRYGILPHGPLGEKILAQQAAIWRARGEGGIRLWQSAPGEYLPWLASPSGKGSPVLQARLMQGEYRSVIFNITNASSAPKELELAFEGLPGGATPGYIAFHPVAWTETPWRMAVAAALPLGEHRDGAYRVRVPAGMTQPVSFTIHGPAEAGRFDGKIVVREVAGEKAWSQAVPVTLRVSPLRYPAHATLGLGGFELASNDALRRRYGVFRETLLPFTAMLREHSVNHPWTTRTEFAFGSFNASHDYATPKDEPETKHFLNWTKNLLPGSSRFHVALTVGTRDHKVVMMGCDQAVDPEGFQKRVNRWLGFWKEVVLKAGLKPEQFYLKIIDEPGFNSAAPNIEDEAIRIWANAIHRSGTGFKVFLNPIHDAPWEVDPRLYDAVDVICVKYSHMLRDDPRYIPFYRERGKELSIYECYGAPAHLYDPYSYFRLQAWMAWKIGAQSMFFWNFSETSTGKGFMDSWNNGLNHWYYTPFFLAPDSVTSSIQSEAMRDGVQDFEYLHRLREAVAGTDAKTPAVERAKALLERAADAVLGGPVLEEPRWSWPRTLDRSGAERMRLEILDCLEELHGAP